MCSSINTERRFLPEERSMAFARVGSKRRLSATFDAILQQPIDEERRHEIRQRNNRALNARVEQTRKVQYEANKALQEA
ncbi:hypothetical protein GHT06_014643 [Daphnia sinensis]|uniref:Uncharacterized protein n=1 Tax=Daphnia sinensis TaxID=1820382 RepID=A0AAD5L891_9CRUS|nr:hypothetical protein GHT06_014643 [Daphnia sinensis]